MKIFALALFTLFSAHSLNAQTEVKKQVTKDIKIEESNGVKTMTITTVSDGKTTREIYSGADVDRKLAEMDQKMTVSEVSAVETTQNVELTIVDGIKTLKITKIVEGKEIVEVFTGAAADEKLKKIEMDPSTQKDEKVRTTIHKETHNE